MWAGRVDHPASPPRPLNTAYWVTFGAWPWWPPSGPTSKKNSPRYYWLGGYILPPFIFATIASYPITSPCGEGVQSCGHLLNRLRIRNAPLESTRKKAILGVTACGCPLGANARCMSGGCCRASRTNSAFSLRQCLLSPLLQPPQPISLLLLVALHCHALSLKETSDVRQLELWRTDRCVGTSLESVTESVPESVTVTRRK